MSKYTTEVRYICEMAAGMNESKGYNSVNEIIAAAYPSIFSFDFPIFDPNYRPVLCKKILKHFYTKEIGAESVGLWKLWLDAKLNEIMPYYNQLYKSELLLADVDPLNDVHLTTEHKGSGTGNNSGTNTADTTATSTNSNSDWELYSDTPQGGITGLNEEKYLTEARKRTGSENGSSTSKITGSNSGESSTTEEYVTKVSGKNGGQSYAKILMELRDSFLNIDAMIIEELEPLFMQIW